MTHKKITELTENTAPAPTDLLHLVDDPSGSPSNQKVQIQTLLNSYVRTAAEVTAGVVPTNYEYEPGNVLRYGTNTTPGTTDMTTAIQNAVDVAAQDPSVYVYGRGNFLVTSTISVQSDNVNIDIDKISCSTNITCFKFGTNNTGTDTLVDTCNVRLRMEGGSTGTAVNIESAIRCAFDLRLDSFEYGAYFTPREGTSYARTERTTLRLNTTTVDYPVYCPAPTNQATRYAGIGDVQILGSELQRALKNIHLEQADGVIISDSVLYQSPLDTSGRTHNIYLRECTWVKVMNTQCFEAGTVGLEIEGCTYVNVGGVHIAWSGELSANPGIYIHDDATNAIDSTQVTLAGIQIDRCSGEGIKATNVDYFTFSSIVVRACSNNHKLGGSSLNNTYNGIDISNCTYFTGNASVTSGGQHKYDLDVATGNTRGHVILTAAGAATGALNGDTASVTVQYGTENTFQGTVRFYGGCVVQTGERLRINDAQATVGSAGAASALPATPTGYAIVNINGTDRVIPYYDTA